MDYCINSYKKGCFSPPSIGLLFVKISYICEKLIKIKLKNTFNLIKNLFNNNCAIPLIV